MQGQEGSIITKEIDIPIKPSGADASDVHPSQSVPTRRRVCEKYSGADKASILWKVSMALTVFSVTLACTGLVVDQFDDDNETIVKLNGVDVTIPSVSISTSAIALGTNGCPDDKGWKVNPMNSTLHSRSGMTFDELSRGAKDDTAGAYFANDSARLIGVHHLGTWEGIYAKASVSKIFGILGVVFQGIALLWIVGLRSVPSPFLFNRPLFGQSEHEHKKGMVPAFLLFLSGACLLVSLSIMSSLMPSILSRVANFALDWCAGSPFDSLPRGQEGLDYMKFLGYYVQDHANAQGVTYMTYTISLSLVYVHTLFLFFLSIRDVRKTACRVNYCLPESQVRRLPFFCRIWPIRVSVSLLVVAVLLNCTAVYSARVRGYPLNIYFYQVKYLGHPDESSWSLSDVLLDTVHEYVVDKSMVKLLLAGWIPTVMLWGFGTGDMVKFTSKVVECFAVLIIARAIVGMSTVPTTPAFVLQKPQCYSAPESPPSFAQFFSISESCNDQLYSLYAVLMVVPAMVQLHYIRYGPMKHKLLAVLFLVLVTLGSMMIVITTRQQYTVDVYIGVLVSVLYCITQGPAFKLLFRFGLENRGNKFPDKPIVLSDNISNIIDDCIHRFELFFMATGKGPASWANLERDDLLQIQSEFNNLLEAIEHAKEKASADHDSMEEHANQFSETVAVGTSLNHDGNTLFGEEDSDHDLEAHGIGDELDQHAKVN